jgi:hypothetical protein
MNHGEVQAPVIAFGVFVPGRDMVGFHDLVALQGFQLDIEAPQPVQVLEDFVSGLA